MNSLNKPKYAIIPGPVLSQNDSDVHWISAHQLLYLYKPPPGSYLIFKDPEEYDFACTFGGRGYRPEQINALIELRPSYSGDYTLP